jgi:hypothetical protein
MSFQRNSITGSSDFHPARDYPPPPRVHWFVLLCAYALIKYLVGMYTSLRYHELVDSIAGDAWAFYLCLWIRSLDSDTRSPFWCDVYVVVELACAALNMRQNPSRIVDGTIAFLGLASVVLGIVTIFLIRSDLQRHYNDREPYGLQLSGVMTFFFSFLYFQYHLYDIAKWREKERSADSSSSTYSESRFIATRSHPGHIGTRSHVL